MLGSKVGGESTGRPGACGEEAVVTTVESKAVVEEVWAVGETPKEILSSKLLTEAGGLLGTSSDLRWLLVELQVMDSLRSTEGLVAGGGILMLERSTEVLVVSG